MEREFWHVDGLKAEMRCGSTRARIHLDRPDLGLDAIAVAGGSFPSVRLLQVALSSNSVDQPWPLEDCYVRGRDLIVVYQQTDQAALRRQAYWRVLDDRRRSGALLGIELILSVQTSLLHSDPRMTVASLFPAHAVLARSEDGGFTALDTTTQPTVDKNGPGCFLMRLGESQYSFAQMVHPADHRGSHIAKADGDAILASHDLFVGGLHDGGLEKGVALRSRIVSLLLRRVGDETVAEAAYQAFLAEAPPLTT